MKEKKKSRRQQNIKKGPEIPSPDSVSILSLMIHYTIADPGKLRLSRENNYLWQRWFSEESRRPNLLYNT